jgi:hypothetical protein
MMPTLALTVLITGGALTEINASCKRGRVSLPTITTLLDGMTTPLKAGGLSDERLGKLLKERGGARARFTNRRIRSYYLFQSHNAQQPILAVVEEAAIVEPTGAATLYLRVLLQKPKATPHYVWIAFDSDVKEPICV